MDPIAEIDATAQLEPISKYIYSQFIEHLGKCIYGGIWAEMLEDRKFYYAPDAELSPWKTKPGSSVTMDTKNPFVGDHTPVVKGEIHQTDLWTKKGVDIVGYAWLKGEGKATITFAGQSRAFDLTSEWTKFDLNFTAQEDTQTATLSIASDTGVHVGTISLMPSNNVQGMRPDVLELLRQLDAPLYRWPGGNFVSGYDWRDGIGDRDRRPPRKNPAWEGIEHNDFGTHEFFDFCQLINTEPNVVVNTGFGDVNTAVEWLEYINGAATTEQGKKRTQNGHQDPWGVEWWGIGNEMYGPWQLGYMAIDQYAIKHNLFVDRMRKLDPNIKTIASSDMGFGDWSKNMLLRCTDRMDLISEHFYCHERESVIDHVRQVPNSIRSKAEAHRKYREELPELAGRDIKIAMDEWNYWYGDHVFGELGTRYFIKDGLGIAEGLHEFFRCTDVIGMAQYAQTVNVIGAIKATPTDSQFETTGLVLKMYREHFGTLPLTIKGNFEPVDVMAAYTADHKHLTVGIVNPTAYTMSLPLDWKGVKVSEEATAYELANSDPMAYNNPGDPQKINIEERKVSGVPSFKPYSVTIFKFAVTG